MTLGWLVRPRPFLQIAAAKHPPLRYFLRLQSRRHRSMLV